MSLRRGLLCFNPYNLVYVSYTVNTTRTKKFYVVFTPGPSNIEGGWVKLWSSMSSSTLCFNIMHAVLFVVYNASFDMHKKSSNKKTWDKCCAVLHASKLQMTRLQGPRMWSQPWTLQRDSSVSQNCDTDEDRSSLFPRHLASLCACQKLSKKFASVSHSPPWLGKIGSTWGQDCGKPYSILGHPTTL